MNPEELNQELDRLWESVSAPSYEPELEALGPPEPPLTQQASLETMALLKNRHRSQILRLQELLALKERTARELGERLAAADKEILQLRRSLQGEEQRIYEKVREISIQLESAQKAFQAREERFHEEEKLWRSLAEHARQQLAAETARWRELESQWSEREQQYLNDVHELQARLEHAQKDTVKHEQEARRSLTDLKEAKSAIEKTLEELGQERRQREESDKERDKALAKVQEVEKHFQELQTLWQEERKTWQELWDRERSGWEGQKQELKSWEEKLRKEREQWHSGFRHLEDSQTRYAEHIVEMLRKASDAGGKFAALLKALSLRGEVPKVQEPDAPAAPAGKRWVRAAAAGVFLIALFSAYPVWKVLRRFNVQLLSSHTLQAGPSGLAYDGNLLWICAWDGTFSTLDPQDPSSVTAQFKVPNIGPYHPVSLALSGEALYSLDAAQGRILRHSLLPPLEIRVAWASPGPAPAALAHDGKHLWSYDAATRTLYRHLGEGAQAETEAFNLGSDLVPTAMFWHQGDLWAYDAKSQQILVFRFLKGAFQVAQAIRLEMPFQSFILVQRTAQGAGQLELWAVVPASAGSPDPTLKKFLVR